MTNPIRIDDIDSITEPIYVLVAGGIAVGKTYVISNHIKTIPIMDIDTEMEELSFDTYDKEHLSIAMKSISKKIDTMMERKENIIAMGTAANFAFSVERLFNAKQAGYKTIILHIKAPLSQAFVLNEKRRKEGKRAVDTKDQDVIRTTWINSQKTVELLCDTVLVDWYCEYDNTIYQSKYD